MDRHLLEYPEDAQVTRDEFYMKVVNPHDSQHHQAEDGDRVHWQRLAGSCWWL